ATKGAQPGVDEQEIRAAVAHGDAQRAAVEAPFVNRRDPARTLGPDGMPAVSRRAPMWDDVPDEKWDDWRWQLSHRVNDLAQVDYLRRTRQVRDVLISGGDGLTLAPKLFESILRGIREIPHIEIIRIGSRVPVFLPQRVDDELCEMLQQFHPLWINLHFNHP